MKNLRQSQHKGFELNSPLSYAYQKPTQTNQALYHSAVNVGSPSYDAPPPADKPSDLLASKKKTVNFYKTPEKNPNHYPGARQGSSGFDSKNYMSHEHYNRKLNTDLMINNIDNLLKKAKENRYSMNNKYNGISNSTQSKRQNTQEQPSVGEFSAGSVNYNANRYSSTNGKSIYDSTFGVKNASPSVAAQIAKRDFSTKASGSRSGEDSHQTTTQYDDYFGRVKGGTTGTGFATKVGKLNKRLFEDTPAQSNNNYLESLKGHLNRINLKNIFEEERI